MMVKLCVSGDRNYNWHNYVSFFVFSRCVFLFFVIITLHSSPLNNAIVMYKMCCITLISLSKGL